MLSFNYTKRSANPATIAATAIADPEEMIELLLSPGPTGPGAEPSVAGTVLGGVVTGVPVGGEEGAAVGAAANTVTLSCIPAVQWPVTSQA